MRYVIVTTVEAASGTQTWTVKAASEAEALAKFNRGGGEFHSEEIKVTNFGPPEIVGVDDGDGE